MSAPDQEAAGPRSSPSRVVAIGGGTGLPSVLRGLRWLVRGGDVSALTAVVAMTDDGGSSGRLRRTRGLPPPGDVRNCLVALAAEEGLLSALFQHRYRGTQEIGGHTLGNLILAALAEQTGSFLRAVEVSSRVLRTRGRILPVTLDDVSLRAELVDGSVVEGETRVGTCGKRIRRLSLVPASAQPTPGVVEAIDEADLVVLGPGSLYTSLVPHLLVAGVSEALRETRAVVVLVANLVSERGESASLGLADHLAVIEDHAGASFVDALLVHDGPIDGAIQERYRAEGAHPLTWPARSDERIRVVRGNLLFTGPVLRHDPEATAAGLARAWAQVRDEIASGASRRRSMAGTA